MAKLNSKKTENFEFMKKKKFGSIDSRSLNRRDPILVGQTGRIKSHQTLFYLFVFILTVGLGSSRLTG